MKVLEGETDKTHILLHNHWVSIKMDHNFDLDFIKKKKELWEY